MFDLSYVKSPSFTPSTKSKLTRPNSMSLRMMTDVTQDTEQQKIKLSKPKKQKIKWKNISMKWQISILILGLFLSITILEQFFIHNAANSYENWLDKSIGIFIQDHAMLQLEDIVNSTTI